eukprot:683578-Prorocentrum_minimum.AAC.3
MSGGDMRLAYHRRIGRTCRVDVPSGPRLARLAGGGLARRAGAGAGAGLVGELDGPPVTLAVG